MFRRIVAARIRAAWHQLQRHNAEPVLNQLAATFEHSFAGDHALGGSRRTRQAQADWFARLFRLLPDARFSVRDVLVSGWPWHARAVAIIDVTLADDPRYRNVVSQQLELRWGRISRIENLEDTQVLTALLQRRATAKPEALAAPITG
jgi:ketosteroid isomerase-like protein